ncbi:MAG: hypothetical protein A2070_04900 [Bdellovibrionales bacterium GWC1_52_8]|nr:MAG: hypothetical protein A2Z97_01835 [Bdellovibrionales bacterium GWB1_52_6]OFZ04938.1 MAG: hypothetical protein A2X97_16240 [Bdellovibrionales bacterium GWA1_52_35]OFZ35252.1 MAG: hypothetical protein A2070_04900 [Bdellovibrionales bacterium GWC1_52_8]
MEVPARVASIIRSKAVQEGQRIKEGQVLYSLAGEDIRLAAEIAEKDFARAARLFRLGSIPQENYEHLRAKRDDASLKLKWCNIEAPSSGTVLNLYREPGEWAGPGMRMAAIADLTEVWATFYVEQTRLASLQLGQKVQAILPEVRGRFFEGTITRIAEVAEFTPKNIQTREERARLVYAIKINFKNEDGMLKPGMSFEARL